MKLTFADVVHEPLLHFVVLGSLLFAADARLTDPQGTGPGSASGAPGTIEVNDVVRQRLSDGWQAQNGAPPSASDLESMIEHWVREEVLFREGMARGLDRDDERVRSRVASKMGFVVDAQLVVPEPSDEELRAYFDAHAERWTKDARIDFTHVYVSGKDAQARAQAMLRSLEAGADPSGMGDTFSGGRRYRARQLGDLATQFGASFADDLDAQAVGTWVVRTSRFGVHVVRVDARSARGATDFAAAKLDVRHALLEDRRKAAFESAVDALRVRWQVVRSP